MRDGAGSAAAGAAVRWQPPSDAIVHRRQRRAVEADLVAFGRPVAAALLGPDVDEDRAVQLGGPTERLEERRMSCPGTTPT